VGFQLPMARKAHRYAGADQFHGLAPYAFTVGPILLAPNGPWNMVCSFQTKVQKIWPHVISVVSLVFARKRAAPE
jgi:hypothetical protein